MHAPSLTQATCLPQLRPLRHFALCCLLAHVSPARAGVARHRLSAGVAYVRFSQSVKGGRVALRQLYPRAHYNGNISTNMPLSCCRGCVHRLIVPQLCTISSPAGARICRATALISIPEHYLRGLDGAAGRRLAMPSPASKPRLLIVATRVCAQAHAPLCMLANVWRNLD